MYKDHVKKKKSYEVQEVQFFFIFDLRDVESHQLVAVMACKCCCLIKGARRAISLIRKYIRQSLGQCECQKVLLNDL